jgi:purine-binding chemotaxis protein CheW
LSSVQRDNSYAVLQVADTSFAIPLHAVREVLPKAALSALPGMPRILDGFLTLDGTVVAVLSLARLFRLKDAASVLYSHLLLLKSDLRPLALAIDRVAEIRPFRREALLPVRENNSFNDCVRAEMEDKGKVIHLLDPARLLLKEEQERVAELQTQRQERLRSL